jgi:hypothetical protein
MKSSAPGPGAPAEGPPNSARTAVGSAAHRPDARAGGSGAERSGELGDGVDVLQQKSSPASTPRMPRNSDDNTVGVGHNHHRTSEPRAIPVSRSRGHAAADGRNSHDGYDDHDWRGGSGGGGGGGGGGSSPSKLISPTIANALNNGRPLTTAPLGTHADRQ